MNQYRTEKQDCTYRVSLIESTNSEEALGLMKLALGGQASAARTKAYWDWKHCSNPSGLSLVLGAHDASGDLASLRAIMQWSLCCGNRAPFRAARPVDTVTHPLHQRKGLFKALTLQAVELLTKEGITFMFNTPNDNSRPGYLKMGWKLVAKWPIYVRMANARWLASRMLQFPHSNSDSSLDLYRDFIERFGQQVEEVIVEHEETRASGGFRTPRTLQYLNWRYGNVPGIEYSVIANHSGSRLDGFVIGRSTPGFKGIGTYVVTDLFSRSPVPHSIANLLRMAAAVVRATYLSAHFHIGSNEYIGLRQAGFYQAPGRGYNFVVRPIQQTVFQNPLHADSWDLSLADLELF